MPRLIIGLIRHGDYFQLENTPSAHQPFPLTEDGMQQSIVAAKSIMDVITENNWRLDHTIDSSRLLRAYQTAEYISEYLGGQVGEPLTIDSFDALAERGVGSVANLTINQIEEIIHNDPRFDALPEGWKSDSQYCLPLQGAESLLQAGERVAEHILWRIGLIEESLVSDTVKLFVGHGAAFRHAAFHLGVLEFDQVAALSMYHAEPVYLERLDDGSWRQVAGQWKVRAPKEHYTD
jgi:2,3-bisphosphoglycerate-dependent phosphoglycerate mutase